MAIQASAAKVALLKTGMEAWRWRGDWKGKEIPRAASFPFKVPSPPFPLSAQGHWPSEFVSLGLSGGRDETSQGIQFVSASSHQGCFPSAVSPSFVEMQTPLLLSHPIHWWSEVTTALAGCRVEPRPWYSALKQESNQMRTFTKCSVNWW